MLSAEVGVESEVWVDEFDGLGRVFETEETTWIDAAESEYAKQITELYTLAEEFGECVSHTGSDGWEGD